jgi:2-haloacid dehalogenase
VSTRSVKALFFDVFGTLVDWRTGVARDAQSLLQPRGISVDWLAFADAWRGQYQPAMEEVRAGRAPYSKLDVLHRRTLQTILPAFGLEDLAAADVDQLTLSWHRLDAWPDVQAGLSRLRPHFLLAPVSNGNTALMSDLARRNNLRWDAILGADHARDFKPKPAVYLSAADAFNLMPAQCMMCAAHGSDLDAAAANGLRTAYIARPQEYPGAKLPPAVPPTLSAKSTLDLASQLEA